MGLIQAVKRFDPEKGNCFSSYASWQIRWAVDKAILDKGRQVRLPVHQEGKVRKVKRAFAKFLIELEREPSEKEIAEQLGWTIEQVHEVQGTDHVIITLDQPSSGEDEASTLKDFIADETITDTLDIIIRSMEVEWLRKGIRKLPQKARYVLVRRYDLDDSGYISTLAELATELRISRERVRQLQNEAEQTLKSETRRALRHTVSYQPLNFEEKVGEKVLA